MASEEISLLLAKYTQQAHNSALELEAAQQPNSPLENFDFEAVVRFCRAVRHDIHNQSKTPIMESAQYLISISPNLEFDFAEASREHIEISLKLMQLKNHLLQIIEVSRRSAEEKNLAENGSGAQEGLNRIFQRLEDLEKSIRNLQDDAHMQGIAERMTETFLGKQRSYRDVSIGAFGITVPLGAVKDLIEDSKKEIKKKSSANLEYISFILSKASNIASDIWERTKKMTLSIPNGISEAVHSIALETSNIASSATVLLINRRLQRSQRLRDGLYGIEGHIISLNKFREEIINLITDFRKWEASRKEYVFESALFKFLYESLQSNPLTYKIGEELVENLRNNSLNIRNMNTDTLKNFVVDDANGALRKLSSEILLLEKNLNDGGNGRED